MDQEFNSLQAQREACTAFISSQKHEGWKLVRQKFDDGGFSGGNLNRPSLKRVLGAMDRDEIDVIVVFKVDRLTRSLAGFAKIIEQFDERGVSFVSVTKQFNTTSSMGRLTLNVLLSFAQFERELTAERIRDKVVASKRKGLWMGGPTPLGYVVNDERLEIDPAESKIVLRLFELYRELGTVDKLVEVTGQPGIASKRRIARSGGVTGRKPFNRNSLYRLLRSPIYIGRIEHSEETYPGQHDAIFNEDL